jgi:microcin C transport system substrate-binding protein
MKEIPSAKGIAMNRFLRKFPLYLAAFLLLSGLGNPNAPRGGRFNDNLGAEPPTLHPITSQDVGSRTIQSFVMESLMNRNVDNYEWEPALAESVVAAKDGKTFTAKLREGIVFSDGKPVTAEDVKFSFDVIFDPKFNTAHLRPYYEAIEKVEVIDPRTVRFVTKEVYFKNFDIVSGMTIHPKHIYGDPVEGPKLNKLILGSGPYLLETYDKGKRIILKKNPKWWGWQDKKMQGLYNYDEIAYRFVTEEQVELEMLKTGQVDVMFTGAEAFTKKMVGEVFDKKINKFEVKNKAPGGYGFIGWNQKEQIFQDKQVRQALTHLMNRRLMIEKFQFGKNRPATGPWHQDSIYASPRTKPLEFDPKRAAELLSKAGWKDTDQDGILDKMIDGKKVDFRFTLLNSSKDFEKYMTIFKEDLKKAGIDMEIKYLEWNSFMKLLDEFKFQAIAMGWGAGDVDLDPKQIWHSSSAVPGGSNFVSYKNPEVDKLIDKARTQMDRKARVKTLQKAYEVIADDAPYLFMFNRLYTFYATQKRISMEKPTYTFGVGQNYWWLAPSAN